MDFDKLFTIPPLIPPLPHHHHLLCFAAELFFFFFFVYWKQSNCARCAELGGADSEQHEQHPDEEAPSNPQIGLTTMHKGCEYCWLTQEDVVRYLLSSIGLFSPVAALPIGTLGIIDADVLAINYHSPASSSLPAILRSLGDQTSVVVVDENEALIGMISLFTLTCCDEAMAGSLLARKMTRYMWRVKRRK